MYQNPKKSFNIYFKRFKQLIRGNPQYVFSSKRKNIVLQFLVNLTGIKLRRYHRRGKRWRYESLKVKNFPNQSET